MEHSKGSFTHDGILKLPWQTYCAYIEAIEEKNEREKNSQYFKNQDLVDEWEENQDDWIAQQPKRR